MRRGKIGGVKAVDTATRLLVALTGSEQPRMLKEIAHRANLHPAKVHRYLVSFVRQGMVRQDPTSGLYTWGPLALEIGAAALRSVSFIRIAAVEASFVRDKANATVAVAVWGTHGATHVLVEEARKSVVTKSQLGSVLPLLTSATGRAFAAYLPSSATKGMIEDELKKMKKLFGKKARTRSYYERIFATVRENGIAQALGDYSPGIHALSCPVFDHNDSIAGVLTALAPAGEFDPAVTGPVAQMLKDASGRVSTDLGRKSKG